MEVDMTRFQVGECESWCKTQGVMLSPSGKPAFSMVPNVHCFSIKQPDWGTARSALVVAFVNGNDQDHPIGFSEGLFWAHGWDIGSPELDEIGKRSLEALVQSRQDSSSLSSHPGVLLSKSEIVRTRSLCALTAIFSFDGSLIMPREGVIIFFSHDDVFYVICNSLERKIELQNAFGEYWPIDQEFPKYLEY
jgi:hypothetical protein